MRSIPLLIIIPTLSGNILRAGPLNIEGNRNRAQAGAKGLFSAGMSF